jgi:hypothetical protein
MKHTYLVCVCNKGYEGSLELRKLYEKIHDKEAEKHSRVRIIDESGEDYLYPAKFLHRSDYRLKQETGSL